MGRFGMEEKMDELAVWLQEHEAQMIEDIGGLVGIESVADENGFAACCQAMEQMAGYAGRDGMETTRHEDYCISITMGSGEKEIGIWNHLDVVPAEGNWLYPPFAMQAKNGFLIGRGVQDNKGPAVVAYYAMRYLREKGLLQNIRVRQILGVREEVGMEDVMHYVNHYKVPDYSFVADCGFPVCCGEKGICRVELETEAVLGQFLRLEGGTVCNSVPEHAVAELLLQGKKMEIECVGVSGHAAAPEGTVNAVGVLADRMPMELLEEKERRAVLFLKEAASDGYGEGLGIACADALSGRLTCNAGVVRLKKGRISLVLDIRYPVTMESSRFMPKLQERAKQAGYRITAVQDSASYYRDKEDPLVTVLMNAWTQETGQTGEPFVMGGGTYARHIPNAVAFGPGMSRDYTAAGLPEGHGNCHCADEAESVENLKCAVRIYVRALLGLDRWLGEKEEK